MAQVLSIEEDKEKIDYYIDVCKQNNIQVLPPDINTSDEDFKAVGPNILYGLGKIAKVGKTCGAIIANRPYNSLEDMQEKVKPNKSVFENLIKAGCFDFISKNRNTLLNAIYAMRGDKNKETKQLLALNEQDYDKDLCREYEKSTIKTYLTYPCLYKQVPVNKNVVLECQLHEFKERRDKKGNMMGFYKLKIDGEIVDALCFASVHTGIRLELEHAFNTKKILYLSGKKDDKDKFLVNGNTKDATKSFAI